MIQPANVHSVHFTAAQAHAADFTITAKNNAVDTADACHCACGKIHAAESAVAASRFAVFKPSLVKLVVSSIMFCHCFLQRQCV